MKNKKISHYLTTGFLLIISALVISCGGKASGGNTYESKASAQADYSRTESTGATAAATAGLGENISFEGTGFNPEPGRESVPAENPAASVERKLVKRADLNIEADPAFIDSDGKLTGVNQKVDELMKKYGAYSESTRSEESYSHFTIRVPRMHYESLMEGTSVLGKLRSRGETAEDVTVQYYDLEGRLNTKKTLLETFQGYLGRANDIDDIMKVETRIAELQNEIDWLGTQLTRLGNLVDYATVELNVYSYRHVQTYTFGDRIRGLFGSFGKFASGALLVILGIIVYGVPVVIVCLIAFWLLFGRVGILKKAFRSAMRGNDRKSGKKLMDAIKTKPNDTENGDTQE